MTREVFTFGNQYYELCQQIHGRNKRMEEDLSFLDEVNITSTIGGEIRATETSDPVGNKAVVNVKLRKKIQKTAEHDFSELFDKKAALEGIVKSAGLKASEEDIFYSLYGMDNVYLEKRTHEQVAKELFYTRSNVSKYYKVIKQKITSIL